VIYEQGDNSNNIEVLHSNKRLKAELVYRTAHDASLDMAVLKVGQVSPCTPLPYAEQIQDNELVRVMGYPNQAWAIREGKVSDVLGDPSGFELKISLSKGSSGSPVLNAKNQVIGMISEISAETIGGKPVEKAYAHAIQKILTEIKFAKL
jgi:V8-like Glu-specific endopeptidase